MALINCPECGKEVSDKAPSCINCGLPLLTSSPSEKSSPSANVESSQVPPQNIKGNKKIISVIVTIIVVLVCLNFAVEIIDAVLDVFSDIGEEIID